MQKPISIFLSFLMLASTSGIAYAQHFCSGMEVVSGIVLGEKDLSCGMDGAVDDSCDKTDVLAEDHCCQDQITRIQTDDYFAKASFEIKFNPIFASTFVEIFVLNKVKAVSTQKIFFADYGPPPLEQDLNILYETFLI